MLRLLKNKKGFTLIELLISIAILGIIFGAICMFIFPTMNFFARSQKTTSAKNAANLIMDYIEGSVYSTNSMNLENRTTTYPVSDLDPPVFYLIASDETKNGVLTTYKENDTAPALAFNAAITEGLNFEVAFSRTQEKVLNIEINVYDRNHVSDLLYTLTKDIFLTNLPEAGEITPVTGNFPEMKFYKPNGSEIITP